MTIPPILTESTIAVRTDSPPLRDAADAFRVEYRVIDASYGHGWRPHSSRRLLVEQSELGEQLGGGEELLVLDQFVDVIA